MFLEPHFGRENQIVLLVLLNPSRGHVGSHIFGESARPEVNMVARSLSRTYNSFRERWISIPLGSVDSQ